MIWSSKILPVIREVTKQFRCRKSQREMQPSLGGDAVLFAETNERVIVRRQTGTPVQLATAAFLSPSRQFSLSLSLSLSVELRGEWGLAGPVWRRESTTAQRERESLSS